MEKQPRTRRVDRFLTSKGEEAIIQSVQNSLDKNLGGELKRDLTLIRSNTVKLNNLQDIRRQLKVGHTEMHAAGIQATDGFKQFRGRMNYEFSVLAQEQRILKKRVRRLASVRDKSKFII